MRVTGTDIMILLLLIVAIIQAVAIYKMMTDIDRLKKNNITSFQLAESQQEQLNLILEWQKNSASVLSTYHEILNSHSNLYDTLADILKEGDNTNEV